MGEDVRQDAAEPPTSGATERVSVQAAAERLRTTVNAIRKRVQRDTIAHEKDPDGRVWILLDTGRTEEKRRHDTLIAQLSQAHAALASRVLELEAPRDLSGAPETASEGAGRVRRRPGSPRREALMVEAILRA